MLIRFKDVRGDTFLVINADHLVRMHPTPDKQQTAIKYSVGTGAYATAVVKLPIDELYDAIGLALTHDYCTTTICEEV